MQWDYQETTLVFCDRHTLDYVDWKGTDSDFIKKIATPSSAEIDMRSLVEI
jgi:hypothetical protein